jgi:hypothetical protein
MQLSSEPTAPQIPGGKSAVHCCAVCHQQWAETMMVRVDSRWICSLCKERALADTTPREQRRVQMRMGVPGLFWLKVFAFTALAAAIGFRFWVGSFRHRPMVPKALDELKHPERLLLMDDIMEKAAAPDPSARGGRL